MKTKIALILTALACAFDAVPAHAEEVSPEQIREWHKAANRGEAWAQFNLVVCYANGNCVEKDLRMAVCWWRKATEQGIAQAQYNLGVCYADGNGVEKDLREAEHWFRKSAEQGLEEAKQALAYMDFSVPERFAKYAGKRLLRHLLVGAACAALAAAGCAGVARRRAKRRSWR